jgi:hypothetical protein
MRWAERKFLVLKVHAQSPLVIPVNVIYTGRGTYGIDEGLGDGA